MTTGRGRARIDTDELNARLLAQAETLVANWLPNGRRQGRYVKFGGIDGVVGQSAWVNLDTGAWRDEASPDDSGGDLISLYAAVRCGGDNAAALRELAEAFDMRPSVAARPKAIQQQAQASTSDPGPERAHAKPGTTPAPKTAPVARPPRLEWQPLCPVPDDAPDFRGHSAHFARGKPDRQWLYLTIDGRPNYVVSLFCTSDGGKEVQPLTFCTRADGRREWKYKAPAEPRPLYGLQHLAQPVEGPVYVVEGEKCADALHEALGAPVLTWQGGAKVPHKADWAPVRGMHLVLWPDADAKADKNTGALLPIEKQPGMRAMLTIQQLCAELGCAVDIVDIGPPGQRADGWDCADAIAEGWQRDQLLDFLSRRFVAAEVSRPAPAAGGPKALQAPEPDDSDAWRARLVWNKGRLVALPVNVIEIMSNHTAWAGAVGYDQFADRVVKLRHPPYDPTGARSELGSEWSDIDDTLAAAWIAQHEGCLVSSSMVAEAVNAVARENAFHPVRKYLDGLPAWDGVDRLDHWLADHLHVLPCEYTSLVGRWFLMAMVARVLQPGVKFDYCLVLEGRQGRMKSTALRILAGEWFSDTELDLANKDSMSAIKGKWLHEFGEMGSIARSESQRQKSFLSREVDQYRPVYGRREVRCPRQVCFAGTTNEWSWQKDATGGRRFWPVEVVDEVNVEGLRNVRDLLFAEAYARYHKGERFWPTAEEQRSIFDPEQLTREAPNAFAELLSAWLDDPMTAAEFTMADACVKGLKLDGKGITRDIETRVGMALAKLACERFEKRTAAVRFWYRKPKRVRVIQPQPESPDAVDADV